MLLCRVPGPCFSRHVHWRQDLFSRVAGSPALHRAPLNELRPVHHEAVFGAPGLSRTGEGGFRYRISLPYRKSLFLHRMPLKMRRVPQEPVFCTARIFRTVGGPLRYRMPTSRHPQNTKAHHNRQPPASTAHPARRKQHPQLKAPPKQKKSRLNVTSIGTSEKRQLPTLPPGGAVPSALVSLTSLFGMGRGGSSPL